MVRFILKRVVYDGETPVHEGLYTIDTQNQELEDHLTRGGGEAENGSYDYVKLVGAEVVKDE